MLILKIPPTELYNEQTQEFITTQEKVIQLEHSLVSISKWEAKWEKPFLSSDKKYTKTTEESLDYVRCMTITPNVDPELYNNLTSPMIQIIDKYIDSKMSATTINRQNNGKNNRDIITSELIYYWMIAYQIPFECQKWHLNRLLTLIDICNIKNTPPNKMSKKNILSRNKTLNEQRKKQYNTGG